MHPLAKGLSILREAEAALRDVVSEAVASGDYLATMRLAAWGQELSRLTASPDADTRHLRTVPPPSAPKELSDSQIAQPTDREGPSATHRQRSKDRKRDKDYPQFFRKGDLLIKIGWSKREKAEYQHKAPRDVLDAVVNMLTTAGRNAETIAIPEFLPLTGAGGDELPPYQVYVCLAWLRKLGLIQQHGREGYTIGRPETLPEDVAAAWAAVAHRRAS
jgi:hypothetical protein